MIRLATVAGALAALVALVGALTPALERAELATIDARFAVRGTQPVSGVAVVGIDERSFSELDTRWPFPRSLHARMLDRLREAGVRQVVYDVQFTEPSEVPDEDLALYDAVARAKRVILATGEIDAQGRTRVLGGDEGLAEAGGARAAASTFPTDPGGAIRRYAREDTQLATIPALVGARFGSPMQDESALIDFRGPTGTIPTYSFADVLERRVGAGQLRGKIVVVGATAPGAAGRPHHVRARRASDARRRDRGQRDLDRAARQSAAADPRLGRVPDRGLPRRARRRWPCARSGRSAAARSPWRWARCT